MHGIAMIGDPALPADFDHLPYANPDAPKGGKITYGVVGTFDSLNPFIVQGGFTSARGLSDPVFGRLVFESLLERSADEPFTLYGNLAETVETPPDRSWVEFTLNPKAKFSDGTPVTVDDVIFSMEILRDKGRPNYKAYYSKISQRRAGRRARRALRPRRRQRPRAAADHRPDAGLPQARHRPGDLRQIDAEAADRQRALSGRARSTRPTTSSTSAIRTTGARTCPSTAASSTSTRSASSTTATPTPCSRPSRRASTTSIRKATRRSGTPPTTFPAVKRGQGRQGDLQDRHAEGHVRLRLQHPPAGLRRQARAQGAGDAVRFRLGEQEPLLRRLRARGRLLQRFGAVVHRQAGERQGEGAARALPRRRRRGRDERHLPAGLGRRRRWRARGRCARRSASCRPPATRSRATSSSTPRPASRSPSRSWWSTTRTRSWRSPISARSSASASR